MKLRKMMQTGMLFLLSILLLMSIAGCGKHESTISGIALAEDSTITNGQAEFLKYVTMEIKSVDENRKTAEIDLTIPDMLAVYQTGADYGECKKVVSVIAPVIEKNGVWVIESVDVFNELIVNELDAGFHELLESQTDASLDVNFEGAGVE